MAVRAAHLALRNLGSNGRPAEGRPEQPRDFAVLVRRVGVIEVQHERIGFATVHTRVLAKIRQEPLMHIAPDLPIALECLPDVIVAVLRVVLTRVATAALVTVDLTPSNRFLFEIELGVLEFPRTPRAHFRHRTSVQQRPSRAAPILGARESGQSQPLVLIERLGLAARAPGVRPARRWASLVRCAWSA